jgi:hypothetical protein
MLAAVPASEVLIDWLRATCAAYRHDVEAVYRRTGAHSWPLVADDETALAAKLHEGGHLLPLPREPAALANVLEVAIVNFIIERISVLPGAVAQRGGERCYPDVEVAGAPFGGGHHAIDVKIAMRRKSAKKAKKAANPKAATRRPQPPKPARAPKQTQSRITLYTGNTYFAMPELKWPGHFRAFGEYRSHLDVIGLYTLNEMTNSRVDNLELIVQEPWRVASKKRSSTTREYIGAVTNLDQLREGRGEFESEREFYEFWRNYKFDVPRAMKQQLTKALARERGEEGHE